MNNICVITSKTIGRVPNRTNAIVVPMTSFRPFLRLSQSLSITNANKMHFWKSMLHEL